MPYLDFFKQITGNSPLPFQEEYAKAPFTSTLLTIPTGLGKTDAVLVPWLYAHATGQSAPTRLIVVLPRQNLTAQTARIAKNRVASAGLSVRVLELMAGSEDNDEKLAPDEHAIIVSTQDLYFSRALNRGYARRPPRWPIDFALYNQDCLIVLDEIQLMDDALATSTQLAAFRSRFGTYGEVPCVWMSATVNPAWLQTVDSPNLPPRIGLSQADYAHDVVKERIHAAKSIAQAPEECSTPAGCAQFALAQHKPGTRTLVIANTVARAREIYAAIRTKLPGALLLHSRFRPSDRKRAVERLADTGDGQIVVATQVLEAGVDITANRLITDIAPWGSLVQRFGRVNRYGYEKESQISWVDKPTSKKHKEGYPPYTEPEIDRARERLLALKSASPAVLNELTEDGPEPWQHVLRRADLLDLFDTTPDIAGNHIDVSRFIRATEDKDAYLAWRTWDGETPPGDFPEIEDDELCPVPIYEFREFAAKHKAYTWNFATEKWEPVDPKRLYAGMVAITGPESGGYTEEEGWSPENKQKVPEVPRHAKQTPVEGDGSDPRSFLKGRQSLRDHTIDVVRQLDQLLTRTPIPDDAAAELRYAAARHDWGKAHSVFQTTMHGTSDYTELLAKCEGQRRHRRPHFRHELASALAILQTGGSDLAAYLAGAHHGRVRLGIRSMPGENEEEGKRTARGIQENDPLPPCELTSGLTTPAVTLSLSCMEFAAPEGSWTRRMLALRDQLGPFRLAYLEMLLRSADEIASAHFVEAGSCRA